MTENLRGVAIGVVVDVSKVVVVLLEFAVDIILRTTNLLVGPIYHLIHECGHEVDLLCDISG